MREFQKSTAAIKASLQKVRFATFTLQKEENPKAGVDVRDEENLSSAPEELRQEREVARCVCSAANMVVINREELLWNCCGWGGWGYYFPPVCVCQYVRPYVCVWEWVYAKESAEGKGCGAAQVPLISPTCGCGCTLLSFSFHELGAFLTFFIFLTFSRHMSDIFLGCNYLLF